MIKDEVLQKRNLEGEKNVASGNVDGRREGRGKEERDKGRTANCLPMYRIPHSIIT